MGGCSSVMKMWTAETQCQMAVVTSESHNLQLSIFLFQVPEPAQMLTSLSLSRAASPLGLAGAQVIFASPKGSCYRKLGKPLFCHPMGWKWRSRGALNTRLIPALFLNCRSLKWPTSPQFNQGVLGKHSEGCLGRTKIILAKSRPGGRWKWKIIHYRDRSARLSSLAATLFF